VNACTIIARNYLAQARVLADSFLAHHSSSRLSVLVLDDREREIGHSEPFEVIRPTEIGLSRREFHDMAFLYSLVELSTAVKPWLLRTLLDRGYETVTYLDPDMRVFAPIDDVSALALEHSLVLTPHTTEPIPDDGCGISEVDLRIAGAFNLGFVAVSADAGDFLNWWARRLRRDCRVAPAEGLFVDQRHVDLAPTLFEHFVLRDDTVNVAYWNAYCRRVAWKRERYEVDGRPLRLFHFSGFDPDRPWLLSRFQGDKPRVLLSENPALARLCHEYAAALLDRGYRRTSSRIYRYGDLNGVPIDGRMRKLYRAAVDDAESPLAPDPFDPSSPDALLEWLNEPVDGTGISRYLLDLIGDRPLSQVAFPDLAGKDGRRFLDWIAGGGSGDVPFELFPSSTGPELSGPTSSSRRLPAGVNVVGHLTGALGIGEAARQMVGALEAVSIPYALVVERDPSSRQLHTSPDDGVEGARYDTNLICVNADMLPSFRRSVGSSFFDGRYSIGMWWWEIAEFPDNLHQAFDFVDEIWVGSEFVRRTIAAETSKPVLRLPLPFSAPEPPTRSRSALSLPEGFLFLFSFDFASTFKRKNPVAVVEAFKRAFEPGTDPTLVVKSIKGHLRVPELEELRAAASGRDDIRLIDGYLDPDDNNALMATCDCYVSLHRSEGFGLTMAEAMSYGKPVVATAYGGNVDFMTQENSYLVPYGLTRAGEDAHPYPALAEWAEPDLDEAAQLMRRVFDNREEARSRGEKGRRALLTHHSPERAGVFIEERLRQIRSERSETMLSSSTQQEPAVSQPPDGLHRAVAWLEDGPVNSWEGSSRLLGGGRLARRALRRVLRPYETRRHEFDVAVVDALKGQNHLIAQVEAAKTSEAEAQTDRLEALSSYVEHAHEAAAREKARLTDAIEDLRQSLLALNEDLAAPQVAGVPPRLDAIEAAVAQLTNRLQIAPYVADEALVRTTDETGRQVIGYRDGEGPADDLYRRFSDLFRGEEPMIRERQRRYLPLLVDHDPVVDLGCGRGELLDLLAANGTEARGVDVDSGMVRYCRTKGHSVEIADAVDYLEAQAAGSIGAIFCAQVIEHLSPQSFSRLFALSHSRLRTGGVLVAETVNPHAIHAFKTFWVDPTHRSPTFPEVAVTWCRLVGFRSATVIFPNGTGELEIDRVNQSEYAVVARKS
jgi:glycosyltransferase involved in cell wall biosynthesis/2-polyprenyl-3-methyl-5-hydroxy-6-metoxy-1,4-benzoquinol methylase